MKEGVYCSAEAAAAQSVAAGVGGSTLEIKENEDE
jgi:hypothetical protein